MIDDTNFNMTLNMKFVKKDFKFYWNVAIET
jgi:hypothetical protein